jgi:integrase
MAWQRKSKPKTKVVRRKLADGTVKTYEYVRKPPKPTWGTDSVTALIESFRRAPRWDAFAPNTRNAYEQAFAVLSRRGATPIGKVTRRALWELHDILARKNGPSAARSFVACVRALFNFAIERDQIQVNPARGIKTEMPGHWAAWTPAQAAQAMSALPEPLRRVTVLALYTGQRRGDLIAMGWSAYDGRTIRLIQQKTGRPLVLPVHPALKAELDAWERKATTILVNAWGKPWSGDVLSHGMSDALERLGFPAGLNIHGLRKLAAANLAEAGCSTNEIAAVTGHTTLAMVQLYTQSADQERLAGAAIIRLQGRWSGK